MIPTTLLHFPLQCGLVERCPSPFSVVPALFIGRALARGDFVAVNPEQAGASRRVYNLVGS
jgi:hypothetical protein